MTSIIKVFVVRVLLSLQSCIINNVQAEDCISKEITVLKIEENTSKDIVFYDAESKSYYINNGIAQGLDILVLKEKLLNKKATLRLYKFWFGVSKHISQLEINKQILFTEFRDKQDYSTF